jgi:hypothetical protein
MTPGEKFIQITTAQTRDGGPILYALDGNGAVWILENPGGHWRQLPSERRK